MNKIIKLPLTVILLIIIFHMINNFIILALDNRPPFWDQLDNIQEAASISKSFTNLCKSPQKVYSWYYNLGYRCRAPLYRLVLSLFCSPQKNIDIDRLAMVNILFLAILLFSVYGIGAKLYSSQAGMLAAFMLSMFTGIFAMSRFVMFDFPLTSLIPLSIYLMLLTNNFTNSRFSIFLGISVGLGMLVKVTFIIFILPVLVFFTATSLVKSLRENIRPTVLGKNLAIFLLFSLLISGSWYIPNLSIVLQRAKEVCFSNLHLLRISFCSVFLSYIKSLFFHLIGPIFFTLCLISLLFCVRKGIALLLIWLCIPLLIFSASPNTTYRFMLPLLPAISLIIALGITSIRARLIRRAAVIIIIVFSLSYFFATSYGKFTFTPESNGDIFYNSLTDFGIIYPVRKVYWKTEEIMELILTHAHLDKKSGKINPTIQCLSIPSLPEIYEALNYYALNRGININFACPSEADPYDSLRHPFSDSLSRYEFIITKDKYQGAYFGRFDWISILSNWFTRNRDSFNLLGCFDGLPDGSKVCIWENKNAEKVKIP
jgi:4-amino-4-deoxy-L-arabinose transferase-like glycosyltransferase